MQKAFGKLEIKSLNEDLREITGIATTPATDRVGDIVDPMGASFAASVPFLWQHDHSKPIGKAVFGKPTPQGIPFTAKIAAIGEAGALKDLVDLAWQSIKNKLVESVSIGFLSMEDENTKGGGLKFKQFEIYELSAVTIPANPHAVIHSVKALHKPTESVKLISTRKSDAVKLLSVRVP